MNQTDSTVRLTVRGPVWLGEDQAACLDGTTVDLGRPLGGRTVVDQSNGHRLKATIRP